ncbi:MAG: DUF4105 domain-containing protein [bacterium]
MSSTLVGLILAGVCSGALPGRPAGARVSGTPGAKLRVELLTMGPGREAYSRFGHSGIRVTHLGGLGDIVFNFGTFNHEDPAVIRKFLQGRLQYWLSVQTHRETLKEYRDEGRRVIAQELRLTGAQRRRLFLRLHERTKPAYRNYRYHHFRANCSTKIRDVLDWVLDGALKRELSKRPARTYRHWLRRATRGAPGFHLGFDLVLTRADRQINAWEACFAPEQLMTAVDSVLLPGPEGRRRPLVVRKRILQPGPAFQTAGGLWPWTWAMLGSWLALLLLVLPVAVRPRLRASWRVSGIVLALWGLLCSGLSVLLCYVWGAAELPVFTGNQNLIALPPTHLIWAVVGVVLVLRPPARAGGVLVPPRWLVAYAILHCAALLLYVGLHLSGVVSQGNGPLLAVVTPWAMCLIWLLYLARFDMGAPRG